MPLICRTCGTVNQDLGGDPRVYRCGRCGQATLQRTSTLNDTDKKRLGAAIAEAAIEVIFTLVLAVAYYAISWRKCGDCDHKKLGWIAVTGLGGVTGVFIFV